MEEKIVMEKISRRKRIINEMSQTITQNKIIQVLKGQNVKK